MYYPRIRYKFINNLTGEIYELKDPPRGWDESERNIKRSTKNFSLVREYSKNLEFIGDSGRKLTSYKELYDIEADISLVEERLKPNTIEEEYYVHTIGELDFSEYSKEDRIVKVPFLEGGLDKLINAQIREKFDLKRTESLDGVDIGELPMINVNLIGKAIFRQSLLEYRSEQGIREATRDIPLGHPRERASTPPLEIITQSDEADIQQVFTIGSSSSTQDQTHLGVYGAYTPESDKAFYLIAETEALVFVRVKARFKTYNVQGTLIGQPFGAFTKNERTRVEIHRHLWDGNSHNYQQAYVLYTDDTLQNEEVRTHEIDVTLPIPTAENNSLFLAFNQRLEGGNAGFGTTETFKYEYESVEVIVYEENETPNLLRKGILMHDIFKRFTQIITGRDDAFYSQAFGSIAQGYQEDGKYALQAVTTGFLVRNFEDKPITISLKDALDSVDAVNNMTYSIYATEGIQKMYLEELQFFFQPQTVIDLGDVSDLKESVAEDLYYRGTTFGYSKPEGDRLYEEAFGLDEFNTQSSWTLPITRSENTYEKISKFRADSYGRAFAALKPKENDPEEDTEYDKGVFLLDLKQGVGLAYDEKVFSDYYDTIPTGTYSPETSTGLAFTPYRISEKHEWFYAMGLQKQFFSDKYVRFANSFGNAQLVTQVENEIPRAENGDKQVRDLTKGWLRPTWYEFSRKVDFEIAQLLEGNTEVNGRKIPNVFFKVKFVYKGLKYSGYIFEVKPASEGKWKLLKAV